MVFSSSKREVTSVPELCLICYGKLSKKELTTRNQAYLKEAEEVTQQERFSMETVFTLKILLGIPNSTLETFLLESGKAPALWISLCKECNGRVADALLIYQNILELCWKIRNVQEELTDKIRETKTKVSTKGCRSRDQKESKLRNVTDECRKVVNDRGTETVEEGSLLVEDVSYLSQTLLSRLCLPRRVSSPPVSLMPEDDAKNNGEALNNSPSSTSFKLTIDEELLQFSQDPPSSPLGSSIEIDYINRNSEYMKEDVELKSEPMEVSSDNDLESFHIGDTDTDRFDAEDSSDGDGDEAKRSSESDVQTISKNKFDCPSCDKKLPTESGLKIHSARIHKIHILPEKKTWTCPRADCKMSFQNFKAYRAHRLKLGHEKESPKKTCPTCGKGFESGWLLRSHKLLMHSGKNPVKCPICNSFYTNATSLRTHIAYRHKEKQITLTLEADRYPCPWEGCDKVVTTPSALKIHISYHEGKPLYKCTICDQPFYTYQFLKNHKETVHLSLSLECETCGKVFNRSSGLKQHQKRRCRKRVSSVESEKPFVRVRSTFKKPKMRKRLSEGSNVPPVSNQTYQCYLCRKLLKSDNCLQSHLKYAHEGKYKYKCEICGKGLRAKNTFKIHMAKRHGVTDDGIVHQCSVIGCRRVFPDKEHLDEHTAKEHGASGKEQRFQCSYCGKGFHQKYKFTQHEMLHLNQETKPFKCDLCGKGFANHHNMRYHQLNTHKAERKIDRPKETKPRSYLKKETANAVETKMK